MLFAFEYFHTFLAFLAFHITAPVEFAVTLPSPHNLMSIVTPATAHQITPVFTGGRLVTLAVCSPRNSSLLVAVAVIGRTVDVNQVSLWRLLIITRHER